MPSTNEGTSFYIGKHLQELDFLLPSAASIGSNWQTQWHEVDPSPWPALILSKNSVDIMLSDLTGSLALIKHLS